MMCFVLICAIFGAVGWWYLWTYLKICLCVKIYTTRWWHKRIPKNVSVLPNGGTGGIFGPSPGLELIFLMVCLLLLYVYFWFIGKLLKNNSDSGLDNGGFQQTLGYGILCLCMFLLLWFWGGLGYISVIEKYWPKDVTHLCIYSYCFGHGNLKIMYAQIFESWPNKYSILCHMGRYLSNFIS